MDDERARETAVFFTKDMSFLVLSFHILSFLGHVNAIMYIYIYMCVCVCFFSTVEAVDFQSVFHISTLDLAFLPSVEARLGSGLWISYLHGGGAEKSLGVSSFRCPESRDESSSSVTWEKMLKSENVWQDVWQVSG